MNWMAIDGSFGEGGGQLSRYAVALAAITGRAIHLQNIRAKRSKPGLMPQHLTALKAVAAVSGGVLEGAELKATEIRFQPGRIAGGAYQFDVTTAGGVVLVLQALLPVVLHADGPVRIAIIGGTDLKKSPPLDYFQLVFLPWLARMGVKVRIEAVRHGYYPRGGGMLELVVHPCQDLKPIVAETPGPLRLIRGISHVARLPMHIPERMSASAGNLLTEFGPVRIDVKVLDDAESFGTGGAIVLAAETERSILGAAAVARRGVLAEQIGQEAGQALRAELEAGAAVDIHAADQLLIYAAQAKGRSLLAVREVSLHAKTVMWLAEQFLPVRFDMQFRNGLYQISVGQD